MSKPPEHPSGRKRTVCVTLSPDHLERLDQLASEQGRNRSNTIERMIDKTQPPAPAPKDTP